MQPNCNHITRVIQYNKISFHVLINGQRLQMQLKDVANLKRQKFQLFQLLKFSE